ncbi:Protein of unknown function [Methanobrevibacter olleyae]|uniref:DUF3344 domain-containing protein n=1 Tax=Methanobrevibacter olleyae TaxID=294671 RepID=A0A1I4IZD3_METOL|nr:DUF3344 domain-containing protein [Methanobrevibacter olleyae]SFL59699.1 Protein of unknown function [Methanobrevibacter olleyae]
MRNNVKNSSLFLILLIVLVLSISSTFAQDLDNSTDDLAVYNDGESISIENQDYEYEDISSVNDDVYTAESTSVVNDDEYETDTLSVANEGPNAMDTVYSVNYEENLGYGETVPPMPEVDSGVVSGGIDFTAVNPWTTSGNLVYTIPDGMTNLKSAIVIVNVYSGSGANTYALYSNVSLDTKNGLEELGYEALYFDTTTTNDPNVYLINDHTTKQYSDCQMVYNITNKVNSLSSGDLIKINVVDSPYPDKNFDGKIKLISLLFAFDDGDNDKYAYWLHAGQLWTQDTANFDFNTQDYTGATNNMTLRTIALSSSVANSYKINNITAPYDSSSQGSYYLDIKWNNLRTYFNEGNKTNFWYQNTAASYKTNVALLTASELESEQPLTEVYVDYANGNDGNLGTSLSTAFKTISHALSVVEENGIININGVNYLDDVDVNGLNIDKNISIIGLGDDATIDAKNISRIFNIGAYTVNLSNLAFTNANVASASDKRGGALWVNGATLTIDNCKFINNTAGASSSYGGAINLKSTSTTIKNSYFENNSAFYTGGGINAENNNVLLNISDSIFTLNEVLNTGWATGAGICAYNTVIIDRSSFYGNKLAEGKNGRSINEYSTGNLTITNSILLDGTNSVYVTTGPTTLENNWWGNNDTTKDSTPKDLGYTNADLSSYLYLNMTAFASGMGVGDTASININLVSTDDETINIMNLPATLTAVNGNVNPEETELVNGLGSAVYTITTAGDNSVTVHVLGIEDTYSLSSEDIISTEVVYVNSTGGSDTNPGNSWDNAVKTIEKAISIVDDNGTIYVADGLYQLSDSTPATGIAITKNISIIGQSVNAVISGGNTKRIFTIGVNKTLNITSLTLTNAHASGSAYDFGGAILIEDSGNTNPIVAGNLIITDSVISNSYASYGGAIGTNRGTIDNINNVTFINNSALSGGVFYIQQKGTLTIGDNCKFINNTASGRGSVTYAQAKVTTGKNNFFYGNIATGNYGYGTVFGYGFEIGPANVFVNNKATQGGALYLGGNSFTGFGSYCIFINSTDDNGRPVVKQSAGRALTLDNCYWGTNTPDFSALCNGAINYTSYLILNISSDVNSVRVGDSAVITVDLTKNQNGTTVDINSLPSVLPLIFTVENGNVNPIETELLNGIGLTAYSPAVMGEGSVTANIYAIAETLSLEVLPELGTVFVNYTGGLDTNDGSSWDNAIKTISHALEIVGEGKTIYIADGLNYLDDSTADGLDIGKNLSIVGMGDDVVIDANNNGRIFSIGAYTVNLSNLIFINGNSSTATDKRGGALYVNGTTLIIDNCKFINNTAGTKAAAGNVSTYAGAINLKSSTTTIINSEFEGNTAWSTGAGINAENSNVLLNISDSTFINNILLNNGWSAGAAICAYNTVIINKSVFYGNRLTDETRNGRTINQYGNGSLTITNSILLDGEKGVWIAAGPTTLENNWWGNNNANKDTNPEDLGYTNANVNSYLVLSSKIEQENIYNGDLVTVTTTLENNEIELPITLNVNIGEITPNEATITSSEVSIYNATTLGDAVITIDVLGIKNEINFFVKETLPNVNISQIKTQWADGIYPGVNNTFNITLNNGGDESVENLVLEVYSNETGELIASYTIDSIVTGTSSILVTDPTIRPITEESLWPAPQNNKIKFTFNLIRGEDLVTSVSVDKMLAYNGYFNKTYAYGGHDNIINRNYTISGDIIIATQDVSTYGDQYTRFRNETWNIETPEDAEIVKVLLYFNYNWDTSFFPNGWNLTFNDVDILNDYLTHETDRGNLGGWGAYNYGLLVFDVTDYYKTNENNSFVINKTGNCALYPSTLYVLYNLTDSAYVKDVYFSDICDVYYPNYNQFGYDDLLKTVVNYNDINLDNLANAIWYVFTGSSSMNNNLTFNDGVVVNPFNGYTANDCRPYIYDVTSLIKNNNEAWFITGTQSSTTVAYEQVLVVGRIIKTETSITVANDTVNLTYGDEFEIGATLTPTEAGELTYTSSNESVAIVENGKIIAKAFGNAIITVSFEGNEYYEPSSATIDVTVNKKAVNIVPDLVLNDKYYPGVVTIIIRSDVDGLYNVTVGKDTAEVNVTDGLGYESFIGIDAGIQNATVKFLGNEIYNEITVNREFEILKQVVPNFNVEFGDATYPDNVTVLINGPSGTYTVKIDDEHSVEIVVDEDNVGIGSISGLAAGTYSNVNVSYGGNDNVEEGFKLYTITVKKPDSKENISDIIEINTTVLENSTDTVFSIILPKNATGYLLVDVNGKHYYAPVENGTASLAIPGLAPGNYSATVTYTGDDNYASVTKTTTISVPSNVPDNAFDIPKTSESSSATYSVKLPPDATGYLEVDVDGTKYVAALNNGFASVTVAGLSEGKHNVTVTYTGDGKYSSVRKSTTLNVHIPVYKITKNKNVAAIYSAKTSYKVLITKDGKAVGAGEKVTIKYNGKTYTVKTDSKGYASLKLNTKIKVKKYTITATYKGVKVSNKVTIKHVIKASNKKVKKSKKVTKVKVSLKKVNGKYLKAKKLKIKFSGKNYKVKTNKKGVATWKVKKSMLKKLKVGKKYKYKVTYGKDSLTKKLTIK